MRIYTIHPIHLSFGPLLKHLAQVQRLSFGADSYNIYLMLLHGLADTHSLVILLGLVSRRQALLNQSLRSAPVAGSGDVSPTVNLFQPTFAISQNFFRGFAYWIGFNPVWVIEIDIIRYLICDYCLKIG